MYKNFFVWTPIEACGKMETIFDTLCNILHDPKYGPTLSIIKSNIKHGTPVYHVGLNENVFKDPSDLR